MKVGAFNTIYNKIRSPRKTICVLGSARSGTSMVSGLLRIMGINMGDNLDPDNNEDRDFHQVTHPLSELVLPSDPGHKQKLKDMKAFIKGKNQNKIWGWKDPQAIFYFDKIDRYLENPHCIMIFRDPLAIVQREIDQKIFEDVTKTMNTVIKRRFNQMFANLEYIEQKKYALLLISYERALRQKFELIDELASFIDVELTDEQRQACEAYIKADRGSARITPS